MAMLYGILIAFLMGLSAFAGAWVVLKLKTTPQWRPLQMLNKNDDDDKRVAEEIQQQRGFEAFNIEDIPTTPGEMGRRFTKRTASEELKHATRK